MQGSQMTLVAKDGISTNSIQEFVRRITGQSAFPALIASVRDRLGPNADGLLLLVSADDEDSENILRLVQEISLRQLPPVIIVIEMDGCRDLSRIDPYVIRRLRWPAESALLEDLVREYVGQVRSFPNREDESLGELIGRRLVYQTPSLQLLVEPIALAASYDVPVLLSGETGTGKTFLARLIHDYSPRKNERFLVVSCGALASNLIESEFFGHAKGAFTGADRAKEGKFAAAGNGTLLLDEIDTLGLEQQSNLLRVLETGEYEPIGSNQTQVCSARIIAASNWNLEEAVESGKFRRDLYYRLHVMAFHLPPLRERVQDIAPLVRGMAAHFNRKFRKELFDMTQEAMAALESFPWPGNIRQLENVVQQAVLVSTGPELLLSHLSAAVQKNNTSAPKPEDSLADTLAHNREEAERAVIQRALVNCRNSRTHAARALGISRVTLYKKMKKYGLLNGKALPIH